MKIIDALTNAEIYVLISALGLWYYSESEPDGAYAERNNYSPVTRAGLDACLSLTARGYMTLGYTFHVTRAGFNALNEGIMRVTAAPGIFDEADKAQQEARESSKRIAVLVELQVKEARARGARFPDYES